MAREKTWQDKLLGYVIPMVFVLISSLYTITWVRTERQVQKNTDDIIKLSKLQSVHVEKLVNIQKTADDIKSYIMDKHDD